MNAKDQRQAEWEARYQAGKTGWDRRGISPILTRWLESGEITPCRILIPGAGHGHEAAELARHGFEVTAVDIAPSAIRSLNKTLRDQGLTAEVIEADILEWEPQQPFAAIYEQTCLCALDPDHWAEYVTRLSRWLQPGGRLFAAFMQTHGEGGPPYHCDPGDMRRLFRSELWQWPEEPLCEVPHPNGFYELAVVLTLKNGNRQVKD
jgi:SAM-dependent methyltransferase